MFGYASFQTLRMCVCERAYMHIVGLENKGYTTHVFSYYPVNIFLPHELHCSIVQLSHNLFNPGVLKL